MSAADNGTRKRKLRIPTEPSASAEARNRRHNDLPPENTGLEDSDHRHIRNLGMRQVGTFSLPNILSVANSAADFVTMGAVSDTRRFGNMMFSRNPRHTWGEAALHRVEHSARFGLRMAARYYAASYMAGRQLPAVVSSVAQPLGRAASWFTGGLADRGLNYLAGSAANLGARLLGSGYQFGAEAAHQALRLMTSSAAAGQAYSSVVDRVAAASVLSEAEKARETNPHVLARDMTVRGYYRAFHGEDIRTIGWEDAKGEGSHDTRRAMGYRASESAGGMPYSWGGFAQHDTALFSWEWGHLRGNSLGGKAVRPNLASIAHGANTEMIPGERAVKNAGTRPRVNTAAFLRAGSDAARAFVFRARSDEGSLFNQHIDGDRWPVTKREYRRIQAGVTRTSQYPVIPSAVQASIPFRIAATAAEGVGSLASAAYDRLPSRAAVAQTATNVGTALYNSLPSRAAVVQGAANAGAAIYNRLPSLRTMFGRGR